MQAFQSPVSSSRFLQNLINAIADPLLVKDRQHRWVLFNEAFCQFVERQPSKLLNRTDADFLPAEQVEIFWQKDEQVFLTGITTETEELFQDAAGHKYEISVKKSLLQDESGELFLVCITRDIGRYKQIEAERAAQLQQEISEHQQTEQSLRQSQQLLQLVMDNIPQLIFWKDQNLVYQGCNQTGARSIGLDSPDQILGKTDYDLPWPIEQANWYRECDRRIMQTGIPDLHSIEPQQQTDGKQAWLDSNKLPLYDKQGNAIGVLVTVEDITDRKAAEEALMESETRFRSIVENANDAIVMLTPQGELIYSSPQWFDMFGYRSQETLYQHFDRFIHPEDLTFCLEIYSQIATGAADAITLEYRAIHRDGSCRWHTTNLSSIKDTSGQVQHCIAIVRDMTERKLAETQLQQQAKDLHLALQELQQTQMQMIQAEKMSSLGQLVAGVAHEINNPVNFISGNLTHASSYTQDLLELVQLYETHYPEPVAEIVDAVEAIELDFLVEDLPKLLSSMRIGAERIQTIVASLRNFSRMDEAEMKAVSVHDGIDSTLMILQSRLKAKGSQPQIEVIKQYGELPLVECYAGQLNQVFMNIVTNAIDALEEQAEQEAGFSPVITIRTEQLQDNQICVQIADNGVGMSETVQQRLFDPFFTTKPVGKGTGMGLSISYQIVTEKHGGTLSCSSMPAQGTVFSVVVPVEQADCLS